MKKQEKQVEYVDEFRKISTLQKLPNMNDRLRDFFQQDVQKENNNFMRMRKEPAIDKYDNLEYQKLILDNKCVDDRVDDRLTEEKDYYENQDKRVRQHINMFKKWSDTNKTTQSKKQIYKFFYKNASPPKGISQAPVYNDANFDKLNKKKTKDQINEEKFQTDELLFNFNNQDKYDFRLINQKRTEQFMQNPVHIKNNEAQKEQDIFQRALRKFQKYKTINAISQIEEWKLNEQQFFYDLNKNEKQKQDIRLDNYLLDKFIYKSVTKSLKNTQKDVQYFRDIGLPSRNLDKYTEVLPSLKMNKQKQKQLLQQQTKEQAHFLHLLRQSQLNINKQNINFDDISNISNGRVTCLNAYMCIRSQKITKAQFQKLLKRLDRYKKQQMKKGKQRQQAGDYTQNYQPQTNVNQRANVAYEKDQINQLIQQIGEIRQSSSFLSTKSKKPNQKIQINSNVFRKEQFTRLQILLKKLYQKIVVDPHKYPFSFLENYIDRVDQILHKQYKNGKLLWFIMDCYEQIIKTYPQQDSIKTVLKKKPIQQPKVTHFKGQKLLKQEQLKSTHLFTYRQKDKDKGTKVNDRSKSPLIPTRDREKTPRNTTTPTKRTQTKKPNFNNNNNTTKRTFG